MSVSRYVEIRTIGMGSFGRAILVRRKEDNALLVMKEIKIDEMIEQERNDAMNEVLVLKTLQHPNIIAYEESFIEDGVLHIVMEYANGGDLHDVIAKQTKENNSYLPEQVILCWFVQISLALQHVHEKNILHRDLKTQNIFLAEHGATIKLGDFGIAKVLNSNTEFAKTVIGTPYYLSPEICEDQPYDSKSDIWSLGCVLYELVTLRHAFDAQSLPALVLKILKGNYPPIPTIYSQELKSLISSMLQTDPHNRPTIRDILTLPLLINFINMDTKPNLPLSLIQVSPVIKKKQPAKPSPPSSSKLKKPAAPINKAVAVKSKVSNSSPSSTSTSKSILPSKNSHTPSPKNSPIKNANSNATNNNNNNNNNNVANNNNNNPTTSPLDSQKYVPTPRPSSASSSSPYVSSFIKGVGKNPPVSKIAAKKPPSKPSPPLSKKSAVNSPQKINNSPSTHNSNTLTSTNSTQVTHSPISHHLPSFAQKVPDLEGLKKREANYKEQLRGVKSRISKNIKPFSQFSNQQNDTDAIVIDSTHTNEKGIDDNNNNHNDNNNTNDNNDESNNDNPNTENIETVEIVQTAQPNETPTPTIKIEEQPKTDEKTSTRTDKEKLVSKAPDSTITTANVPTSKKTLTTTKPNKDNHNQTKNSKNNNNNNNKKNTNKNNNNKNKNIAVSNSKKVEEKKFSLKDIIKERRKINNSNGELEVEILVPKYTPPIHTQNNNSNESNETDTQPKNETNIGSHTNTEESHTLIQPSDTKTETQQQTQNETQTQIQTQTQTQNNIPNETLASGIQTQSNIESEKQSSQQIRTESNIESNNEKSKSGTLNSSLTTSSMNSSDREARLSLRIESLRQLCEEYFGIEMFFKVYKYLRDNDEDDNETQKKVKEMVPIELQNRLRFIDQLIYCEIQFYGS